MHHCTHQNQSSLKLKHQASLFGEQRVAIVGLLQIGQHIGAAGNHCVRVEHWVGPAARKQKANMKHSKRNMRNDTSSNEQKKFIYNKHNIRITSNERNVRVVVNFDVLHVNAAAESRHLIDVAQVVLHVGEVSNASHVALEVDHIHLQNHIHHTCTTYTQFMISLQ